MTLLPFPGEGPEGSPNLPPARDAVPSAHPNLAQTWARLLVRSLAESGVRRFVVAPGSRSTPLALALAAASTEADARIQLVPVIDERAAGFAALGMARATGEPAAVLCTSGTAAAHLFPAIVEASEAGHPLIAITADRPWEAHGCGSPQTIDQTRLYGAHVRRFVALGVPDPAPDALRAVARNAAQVVAAARGPDPGPVHLDVPFRKPLEPVGEAAASHDPLEIEASRIAVPRVHRARVVPDEAALASLERALHRARRGVIVAGPCPGRPVSAQDADAVRALADATGFPVLAEATSGLRFGLGEACVGAFDAILRAPSFAGARRPDLVLQLGWASLSPAAGAWIAGAGCPVFAASGLGWSDPHGAVTDVIPGDPFELARAIVPRLSRTEPADPEWRSAFRRADIAAWAAAERVLASAAFPEGAVARAAVAAVPEDGWLLVGNSRPVRDLDSFVPPGSRRLRVLHQRGAAGIDGLVAGAAGASIATGAPGLLLLGDVSLAHDLGALALAREVRAPLAILAVDNGGGRIFEELPLARRAELARERERLFTTAPRIDWASAARAFGIAHASVEDAEGLTAALAAAMKRPGATLVVAVVSEPPGATPRTRLHDAVRAALEGGAA